ncbi:MAG: zinc ribbon domain-containing protein [Caldilineaceae bacterium]|nr:zinc ribbon domain-containing protein [Caldilineaceae bacterium]
MSDVQRICPHCGEAGPLTARYCPHCGQDSQQAALPVQQSNFPLVLSKAALPLLAGAASLALRAGWKLLQSRLAANMAGTAVETLRSAQLAKPLTRTEALPARRPRRTIRIRSAWSVTDGNGVQRSGMSEHQIELDD